MSTKCNNLILKNCNKKKVEYNKLNTGGNNPSISKSQRASQYLNTVKPSIHYENPKGFLENKGLIYTPVTYKLVNFKQTYIENDIVFPRERIFI
jgi:hypothetical protein